MGFLVDERPRKDKKKKSKEHTLGYVQEVELTDKEKFEMYMKCTKKELVKMLMENQRVVDIMRQPIPPMGGTGNYTPPFTITCEDKSPYAITITS